MRVQIINADAREGLTSLAEGFVQCVVTSPPYWGLRDYGLDGWEGGNEDCDHAYGRFTRGGLTSKQASNPGSNGDEARSCRCGAIRVSRGIGLEESPEAWVGQLVDVFRKVRRVLCDDGTVWVNVGDAYSARLRQSGDEHAGDLSKSTRGVITQGARPLCGGLKEKDLIGLPWRLAFALQADGWYLRSDIIWAKPNPMPESVRDRPTKSHEYVFLLTKQPRYYYDQDAVRMPWTSGRDDMRQKGLRTGQAYIEQEMWPSNSEKPARVPSGWNTGPGGHGTIDGRYPKPDKQRGHSRRHAGFNDRWDAMSRDEQQVNGANLRTVWTIPTKPFPEAHFATFPPDLVIPCVKAGSREGDTVLDPFCGSGTTGVVARKLGRDFIGIELNPEYAEMARKRIDREAPASLLDGDVS